MLGKLEQMQALDPETKSFLSSLKTGQVAFELFEYLPDVFFWLKNKQGYFQYVNDALARSALFSDKDNVLAMTDHDIHPVELASIFRSDDLNIIKTGERLEMKTELVPNETCGVEWRETSKIPLYDNNDEIVGTAGISRRMGITEGRPGPSQHRVMNAIIGAIYKCVDQEIKVTDLSEAANVSVSTLERIFKQNMGTTPKKFVLQAKLSTACERLIRTKKSVSEIGDSIGYHDHANFTRAFRKLMGVNPTRYRELYKHSTFKRQKLSDFNGITD